MTTPRAAASVPVATTTGFPRSSGRRSSSTETKNASMSTWATTCGQSCTIPAYGPTPPEPAGRRHRLTRRASRAWAFSVSGGGETLL